MKKINTGIVLALSGLLYSAQATADLVITEAMPSSSATVDWFELTNTGASAVSLTGFKMDDSSFDLAKAVALNGIDSIAAGESAVFVEGDSSKVTAFQSVWSGTFSGVRVGNYSGSGVGLGASGDAVAVFNSSGVEQTRQSFGAATSGVSFRWNANNTAATSSAVNDAHGSKSTGSDIGSPGQITGAPVVGTYPEVSGVSEGQAISGVVGDASDYYSSTGLVFTVADTGTPAASLTVNTTSSNPAVATAAAVNNNGTVTLTVTPLSIGYTTITVAVSNGTNITNLNLQYAASNSTTANAATRWLSGRSDLSSIVRVDANTALVADDEPSNLLLAYATNRSGPPLVSFPLSNAQLGTGAGDNCEGVSGSKCDGESDLEAGAKIGNRVFWLGSHSNNKSGKIRPDRWRVFATDLSGSGSGLTTSLAGYYKHLRTDLLAWDQANGHGLGANYLGLVASTVLNLAPESANLNGFSMEGLTFASDNTTAWLGFRAPLVAAPGEAAVTAGSSAGRTHALLIPVTNMNALATSSAGGTAGMATFGAPIRLDLDGRGIREIQRNNAGQYVILAGPPDSATGTAPKDFRLYTWDGSVTPEGAAKNLSLRSADLTGLLGGMAASPEGLLDVPDNLMDASATLGILSDSGDVVFYGDSKAAKDLAEGHRKGRLDSIAIGEAQSCNGGSTASTTSGVFALPNNKWTMFGLPLNPGSTNQVSQIFDELNAVPYGSRWVVYEVDNTLQQYTKLTKTSGMTPGKAYWILTLNGAVNVTMQGTPVSVNEVCRVDVPLHVTGYRNGENAVSNPFAQAIEWVDILIKSGSVYRTPAAAETASVLYGTFIRGPNGSGVSNYVYGTPLSSGSIQPWEAIWVKTKSSFANGTTLSIANP
ncbi:MAG: lamin tail domain-containing protein [Candidatus Thiothrix sulfatifontis]|nr:MAG: lamin tail domain-containing protein [Candidatus Thiothrix sulfatifontis]